MKLTDEQVKFFFDQGYLIGDRFLADAEIANIQHGFMETVERLQRENRLQNVQSGKEDDEIAQVYQLRTAHLLHPVFDHLVRDPRLLDVIESIIGPNIRLVHYQGLYKPPYSGGEVSWHQDDYYFRVAQKKKDSSVTLWLALDDVTVENGCQWFIPGSHCGKLYDHVQNWDPAMKKGFYFTIPSLDPSLEAKAVPILLKKGQFSLHHALMLHRSLKNTSPKPRRGLAIHFFDATITEMWDLFKNAPPETTPVLRGSA